MTVRACIPLGFAANDECRIDLIVRLVGAPARPHPTSPRAAMASMKRELIDADAGLCTCNWRRRLRSRQQPGYIQPIHPVYGKTVANIPTQGPA
jgi:hypothetical protein